MNTPEKSNEIKLIRFYEAPVKAVWDAWTEPEQVAKWWGPRGFTLTSHSKDITTGGHWHYTMHGPNGADYVNKTKYLEVVPYKKLHYDHGGNDERAPLFRVTVYFKEVKGGTEMDMTMALATAEAAEQTRQFIKKAGGDSTWDRFAEYLKQKASGKDVFVINRSFNAPINVVFDMWTDPKHFSQWLAPTGFHMKFIKADIRPNGKTFYSMTAENGSMTLYGCAEYLKIERPHTLVYNQQFCDEHENISHHPMVPTYPETMQTTVQFSEEGSHQTRVTVTWEPIGNVKPEEFAAFIQMRAGMTQGWTGSFDKLEEYLVHVR
ncbi:MAG: SRPBCC family protein [Elusimicrobiota bacterium]